jgi:RTX calcium-binding nonapeptide repeat (4 copies)
MRVRTFGRIENTGTNDSDHLNGFDGTDLPFGNGSQDYLYGGGGNDWLFGGAGNDHITGQGIEPVWSWRLTATSHLADRRGDVRRPRRRSCGSAR